DRPPDALVLDLDIVVEQQDVLRATVADRLEHAAREPARTAEVRLLDDLQPPAEALLGGGEARIVDDALGPLVDHEDAIDERDRMGVVADLAKEPSAVIAAVEGRDGDRGRALRAWAGIHGGQPVGLDE